MDGVRQSAQFKIAMHATEGCCTATTRTLTSMKQDIFVLVHSLQLYFGYWLHPTGIHTESRLATWLRLTKFTELNINELWFLNFNYISHHWEISKNIISSRIEIRCKFFSCRVYLLTVSIRVGSWVIDVSIIYIIHTIITLTDVLCRGKWSVMSLSPWRRFLLTQYTSESINKSYMSNKHTKTNRKQLYCHKTYPNLSAICIGVYRLKF